MKLVIQIPAWNERDHIVATLHDLPRAVDGVDAVTVLVIDDGSRDGTAEVARQAGADQVLRLERHLGLARAFTAGLEESLRLGADVIVNTDADNQYRAADIPALIAPILRGEADLVAGCRDFGSIPHFSWSKRLLQRLGARFVRRMTGISLPDVTTGFRAYSREAAVRLNVFSHFTYTLETLAQAAYLNLRVAAVPIRTNPKTRNSRLFSSIGHYVASGGLGLLRVVTMYHPLKAFLLLGGAFAAAGLGLGLRFLYYYATTDGPTGKVQSVILAAALILIGFLVMLGGLLADLQAANRRLLEEILLRAKREGLPDADRDHRR